MLDLLLELVLMWKILFWSPPSRVFQKLSSSRNEVKLLELLRVILVSMN